jgi:hypothetical protein
MVVKELWLLLVGMGMNEPIQMELSGEWMMFEAVSHLHLHRQNWLLGLEHSF